MGCTYTYPSDPQIGKLDQLASALEDLRAQNERLHRELLEAQQTGKADVLKLDVACQTLAQSTKVLQADVADVGTQAVESFPEPIKANVGTQAVESSLDPVYDTDLWKRNLPLSREIQLEKSRDAVNVKVAPAAAPAASNTLAGAALGLAAATAGAYFTQKSTPSTTAQDSPSGPDFPGLHGRDFHIEPDAEDVESSKLGLEADSGGEREVHVDALGEGDGDGECAIEPEVGDGELGKGGEEIIDVDGFNGGGDIVDAGAGDDGTHSKSLNGLEKLTSFVLRRESSNRSWGCSPIASKAVTIGKDSNVKAVPKPRRSCMGLPSFVAAHDFADCTGVGRKGGAGLPETQGASQFDVAGRSLNVAARTKLPAET
eukprot:TRINITY_DN18529_c0_g2_i1.p1 TRINITY_DN18529_c0_g2~~TRINITY_DN18529_c0_g2_i1.p1  ORF type:complete len:372 (+),score=54.35 TRINITY_DN18529_c0_g2_i1:121-1236(+)